MKKLFKILLVCSLAMLLTYPAFSQSNDQENTKIAQTGMKFLSVSLDARNAAMGDAMTSSHTGFASSMFYNPATMAQMASTFDVSVGQVGWLVDINYNFAAVAYKPGDGNLGVFGFHIAAVDYGTLQGTIRADNERGYLDTGNFSPEALVAGVGYSKALTDRFSVGGNVKYVKEDLGSTQNIVGDSKLKENTANTTAFDFGVLYKTGFRSLNFGMSVRNFAQEVTYEEEGFELPLTFNVGLSMDMTDFTDWNKDSHALLLTVDTSRPRDFKEQIKVGVEYDFMKKVSLRAGYSAPQDEQGISLRAGTHLDMSGFKFRIDYSYTDFGVFDNVNRFSANFSF